MGSRAPWAASRPVSRSNATLLPRIADCTHRLAYTFLVLLLFWQLVPDTLSIARSSSNSGQVSLAELTSGRNAFTGAYSARGSQLRLGQNSYSLLLLLLVILLLIPLSRVSLSGRLRDPGSLSGPPAAARNIGQRSAASSVYRPAAGPLEPSARQVAAPLPS